MISKRRPTEHSDNHELYNIRVYRPLLLLVFVLLIRSASCKKAAETVFDEKKSIW